MLALRAGVARSLFRRTAHALGRHYIACGDCDMVSREQQLALLDARRSGVLELVGEQLENADLPAAAPTAALLPQQPAQDRQHFRLLLLSNDLDPGKAPAQLADDQVLRLVVGSRGPRAHVTALLQYALQRGVAADHPLCVYRTDHHTGLLCQFHAAAQQLAHIDEHRGKGGCHPSAVPRSSVPKSRRFT
jgi:hypothetical protein